MEIDAADPTTWTDADRAIAAWVVGHLRGGRGALLIGTGEQDERTVRAAHLRRCSTLRVTSFEGSDGTYGCETGCEYWRLAGRVACAHDSGGGEFEVGDFGDLEMLLDDLRASR